MKMPERLPFLVRVSSASLAAALLLVTLFSGTVRAQGVRAGPRSSRAITWRPEAAPSRARGDADPPEVTIGERLFLETRFAQFFRAHFDGNVNHPLAQGDPVVSEILLSSGGRTADPFAGASMNCRNCHFVDDVVGQQTNTYGDYSRRSLVPLRDDGVTRTPRNAPPLVNASISRDTPFFLHFDGEFASMEELVRATMTGRNFGWLPRERDLAVAHIARVIREDDGSGELSRQFGGAYRAVFKGSDPSIPPDFRLPPEFRLDVETASDRQVLDAVSALISAYVRSLEFQRDADGFYSGSPFDLFLARNGLPRAPEGGETPIEYSRRLLARLEALPAPAWVIEEDGAFAEHDQPFVFGAAELQELKIFLREPPAGLGSAPGVIAVRTGNCIACHAAPDFTDFEFHNTGASQEEHDEIHGEGSFGRLYVPSLAVRQSRPRDFLPATAAHPDAAGVFRSAPSSRYPGRTDLGLWNVYANPDFTAAQASIPRALGLEESTADRILAATLGRFKTPGLRDLGQSAPYLHTGRKREIEDVIDFYIGVAQKARAGRLRNGAPELAGIFLGEQDVEPLAAFLRALNEDYN